MAKKGGMMAKVGVWAFIIGLILALVFSIINPLGLVQWETIVMVILGLIVGFLNISGAETKLYLIAAIAFIIASSVLAGVLSQWPFLATLFSAFITFTAPGAIVVSFRALYEIAKS